MLSCQANGLMLGIAHGHGRKVPFLACSHTTGSGEVTYGWNCRYIGFVNGLISFTGDLVLDGTSTLTLLTSTLQHLTQVFEQHLVSRNQNHGFIALPSHPADTSTILQAQFLFDILQKTLSLKVCNEKVPCDDVCGEEGRMIMVSLAGLLGWGGLLEQISLYPHLRMGSFEKCMVIPLLHVYQSTCLCAHNAVSASGRMWNHSVHVMTCIYLVLHLSQQMVSKRFCRVKNRTKERNVKADPGQVGIVVNKLKRKS